MASESEQVSHLLSLAAAMSAAQEKATGNGKLDLAGIMAAMTVAQGGSRGVGGWGRIGEANYPTESSLASELNAGHNLIQKNANKMLVQEEKNNKNIKDDFIAEDSVTNQSMKKKPSDSLKRESSSTSLFRSPKPYKKSEELDDAAKSRIGQSTAENKVAYYKLPQTRADVYSETIRDDNQVKGVSQDLNEKWLEKVNSHNLNGVHKQDETQHVKESSLNLSDFLEASDPGIIKLMGKVTNMFATKEDLTGNGKLNLSDLVVAVASIIQDDDTKNKAFDERSVAANKTKTTSVQRGYTQTAPMRKKTTLTVNIGQHQSKGSVDLARKEAIKGAAVAKGVSADKSDIPEPELSTGEPASDPAVRKLVYIQYRGMLKKHSSNE